MKSYLLKLLGDVEGIDAILKEAGIPVKQVPADRTIGSVSDYELMAHIRFLCAETQKDFWKHHNVRHVRANVNSISIYERLLAR